MQELLESVFRRARAHFVYTPDKEQFGVADRWDCQTGAVDAGKVWYGDCDDFALTCAELLAREERILKQDLRLMLCLTEVGQREATGRAMDHMVCLYTVSINEHYVLDNRQRKVLPSYRVPYFWWAWMSVAEPGPYTTLTDTERACLTTH